MTEEPSTLAEVIKASEWIRKMTAKDRGHLAVWSTAPVVRRGGHFHIQVWLTLPDPEAGS